MSKNINASGVKFESLGTYRSIITLAFIAVGVWYLQWRFPTLSRDAPVFSILLLLAEIYGFGGALLHIFMTWRMTVREAPRPAPGLTVDVFIPTYNEPVEIVRRTALAAKHMSYPHQTWLLDDGNRPEVKALAERLNIRYIARQHNLHAKAGNLNNAMLQSDGDFIAIFDADHAPQKHFLTSVLGYFNDPNLAFVQTPQDFFNLDSYQHRWQRNKRQLWTEQALFFKVIQRGKDYWNASFFCGSCAVVRRSALEKIGGFATETVTEDLHTSIKLHKQGYQSVYHSETLAFGIAPANIAPFLKQRIRWGQGAMQVLKKENIFFSGQLSLAQKLNYLASMMTYFDGWQKGLFYVSPAIVLISGLMPIHARAGDFLLHFLPYYILSLIVFEEVGRGFGRMFYIEQYNFARFAAFIWATLGLFLGKLEFKVTSKVRDAEAESNRSFLPQLIVLLLNVIAMPLGLALSLRGPHLPIDAAIFNIVWASVNCVIAVAMLNFTRKTQSFLRGEYRFPIPLPIRVQDDKGNCAYGTIDNISSSSCQIYSQLPDIAKKGAQIKATMYLPSGSLPITVAVMSENKGNGGGAQYVKAIGGRFVWDSEEHHDALELFLYGTDLQWKLLDIHEAVATPLERLMARSAKLSSAEAFKGDRWATMVIRNDSDPASNSLGMAHIPNDNSLPEKIISFASLPPNYWLTASLFTRSGHTSIAAQVQQGAVLESSAGPMYLYPLTACRVIKPEAQPAQPLDVVVAPLIVLP